MADQRISALTELAAAPAAGDFVPIVDLDAPGGQQTKKITIANLLSGGGGGAVDSVFGRTGAVVAVEADYSTHYLVKTGGAQTVTSDITINGGGGLTIDDPTINLRLRNSTDFQMFSSGNSQDFRVSMSAALVQFTGSGFNPPDLSLQIQNWVGLDVNVQAYFQPSLTVGGNSNPGSGASINIPHGSVPTTPLNGDIWTTTAGMFARINGSTINLAGAVSAAYTRAATVVESRALLASASATTLNNNNVLAALIADLQARDILG